MSSAASGSLPSQLWLGVERVKIACDFGDSVQPESIRDSLCRGIAKEAARITSYPVALATPADLKRDPEFLRRQDKQLLLRVHVDFAGAESRPDAAMMSVEAERLGLQPRQGPQTRPLTVKLRWTGDKVQIQRPVTPLAMILGEMRRADLPLPPRSDRL